MPKEMEEALKRAARKKYGKIKDPKERKEKEDALAYGTMRNRGWRPKREKH